MTSGPLLDGPPEAVVYDFNGTLSDDEQLLLRIFTELFEEHLDWRLSPEEYYDRLAGLSDAEIVATAVVEHGGDVHLARGLLEQRSVRYHEMVAENPTITEHTLELVHALRQRRIPQAVVTGAGRGDVLTVLTAQELTDLFATVICGEDVTEGKPAPEGFLRAARSLGTKPERMVVFEDSVPGLRAARAAGMHTIGIAGTRRSGELSGEADVVLDRLDVSVLSLLGLGDRVPSPLKE